METRRYRAWIERYRRLLVACCLGGMLWMTWTAERRTSPTVDELGHLTRGLAWWWAPDTRLSWPHPPLAHALATAPVALLEPRVDFTALSGFAGGAFPRVTLAYADRDYGAMRAQLTTARRTMMVGAALVALWLYAWLRRRQGTVVALIGLVLFASHTAILGDATLLTTDFPFAACGLVVVAKLADYLQSPRWRSVLPLGLALACALVIKHTAILLCAVVLLVALVHALAGWGRFARPLATRLLHFGRDAGLVAVLALLTINAVYRFHETGLPVRAIEAHAEPQSFLSAKSVRVFDEGAPFHRLPGALPVPLPYPYVFGVMMIRSLNEVGSRGFFLGEVNTHGHPAYFPLLALVKTPLGMLVLLLGGLVARVRGVRLEQGARVCAWVGALFLLALVRSDINLGFRHALLLCALGVVIAADAARMLLQSGRLASLRASVVLASLAACVGGALLVRPLFLGDFNLLAGGRQGGLRISVLGDDWMQDVGDLARLARARGLSPIYYYSGFTTPRLELRHFGIDAEKLACGKAPPPGAWAAVHVSDLRTKPECFRALTAREPDTVVNDHVFVYAPTQPPPPAQARAPIPVEAPTN